MIVLIILIILILTERQGTFTTDFIQYLIKTYIIKTYNHFYNIGSDILLIVLVWYLIVLVWYFILCNYYPLHIKLRGNVGS